MSTKIKTTDGWKHAANPVANSLGKYNLVWQAPASKTYTAGYNNLGKFTLSKGKWLIRLRLYTIAAWIRLGSAPDNAKYASYKSYDAQDRNFYVNTCITLDVTEDTDIYVNIYRVAAGNNVTIWSRNIFAMKLK